MFFIGLAFPKPSTMELDLWTGASTFTTSLSILSIMSCSLASVTFSRDSAVWKGWRLTRWYRSIYHFKGAYQIFGEEVVNDDDIEVQELRHGAENVGSDGFEVLHQMDVLSAEAQQHQRSICQDGQLQSPSVSRRGAAKIWNPEMQNVVETMSMWAK